MTKVTTVTREVRVNGILPAASGRPPLLRVENLREKGERLFQGALTVPDVDLFAQLQATVGVGDLLRITEQTDWDDLGNGPVLRAFQKLEAPGQVAA